MPQFMIELIQYISLLNPSRIKKNTMYIFEEYGAFKMVCEP